MGQKTNPTIFNLSLKNAEWKSKYIEKNKEVILWKDFNKNMGISVEYNLDY